MRLRMAVAWVLLLSTLPACRREEPAGRLELGSRSVRLPYARFEILPLRWEPWRELDEASGTPLVFVHLLDRPGSVVRTFDHPLPARWRSGEAMEYEILLVQSALAPPLAPGRYLMTMGLYDAAGRRWPLAAGGEELDRFEYQVAEVEVPAESDVPMFHFSPGWRPTEPGGDRQVLARRWLAGEGSIRVSELDGPATLLLDLRIPEPAAGDEVVVEPGAAAFAVRVGSPCAEMEVSVSGSGVHQILLPLRPRGEEGCEVELRPSFELRARDPLRSRSVSLEALALGSRR